MGILDIFKRKPEPKITVTVTVSPQPVPHDGPPRGLPTPNESELRYYNELVRDVGVEQANLITERMGYRDLEAEAAGHRAALKRHIAQAIPSSRGLYPHEILALQYAPKFLQTGNRFQIFWADRYDVTEMDEILKSLLDRGFIEVGGLKSALNQETMVTLKGELKALDLPQTGKKADLIQRLLAEGDSDALNKKYSDKRFQLTEKGVAELKENEYIKYAHKGYGAFDIWSLNRLIGTNPASQYKEVLRKHYQDAVKSAEESGNLLSMRGAYLGLCHFLIDEQDYDDSVLLMSAKAAIFTLCQGASPFSDNPDDLRDFYESYFEYDDSMIRLLPIDVSPLQISVEMQGVEEPALREILEGIFETPIIPTDLFTKAECVDIVCAEVDEDTSRLQEIYSGAGKRYFEELKKGIRTIAPWQSN